MSTVQATKQATKKINYLPIGFAIFSMFFGAGNSIFPLLIGTNSGDKNIYAVLGMSITALIIPMLGLVGMTLYHGDYKEFFSRLGKMPGFIVISLIMIIIGPFAGIPRCITLSFGTLKPHLGAMPLMLFSLLACSIVFISTIKKRRLLDLLGKVLTPMLLFCLAVIIVKGFFSPKNMVAVAPSKGAVFLSGLTLGYQMMDLLAAFFFASTVLTCLKANSGNKVLAGNEKSALMKAILLSTALLGIIYVGFSFVAAFQNASFLHLPQDALLGAVGLKILGNQIGFIMSLAVALACLTTAITLVSVFADFIYKDFFKTKVPYAFCIIGTISIAFCFSNLGFTHICQIISPILGLCYPALIVLTVFNIAHKLFGVKMVRLPVYLTFFSAIIAQYLMK